MQQVKSYSDYFTAGTRADGSQFMKLVQDAPEELKEFIRSVHQDWNCLPNDWIYDKIHDAMCLYDDGYDLEDCEPDLDCYNSELIKWLENTYADAFCDQVIAEYQPKTLFDIIRLAQHTAASEIISKTYQFISNNYKLNH